MDVQAKLDALEELVRGAKAMPLSASCVVNRSEVLTLVGEVREALPSEVHSARGLIEDRDEVIAAGRAEADRIVAEARTEAARLVSRTEVMQSATREAERVSAEAAEYSERMRSDADDYVDARLANFEVVLNKTLNAVHRGRDKLRGGRDELEALGRGEHDPDEAPLPG